MTTSAAGRRIRHPGVLAALLLAAPALTAAEPADAGATAYATNCIACHGADLTGVEGLGVNLVTSKFVGAQPADALLAFIKVGRMPDDPATVSGRPMPGFGWLPEAELAAIVAFVKSRNGG
jgi:mono/diheme cytochrome c family protein